MATTLGDDAGQEKGLVARGMGALMSTEFDSVVTLLNLTTKQLEKLEERVVMMHMQQVEMVEKIAALEYLRDKILPWVKEHIR